MITGDWRFFWPETLRNFSIFPSAWDSSLNTGMGQSNLVTLWISQYLNFTTSIVSLGYAWEHIGFVFWILPACFLGFFSCWYLFSSIFPNGKKYGWISGLVYGLNSYILMILTGGQLGVALAYGVFPLIIIAWLPFSEYKKIAISLSLKLKHSILAGVSLGLLVLFDVRLAYIAILFLGIVSLLQGRLFHAVLWRWIIPFLLTLLLHAFWLVPLLLYKDIPMSSALATNTEISFYSFADFAHAFSLLHPNWPENIFGKVSFLAPQFLLLPLFAYSGFLFIRKKHIAKDIRIYYYLTLFGITGMVGVFLAKGTQEPFGQVYEYFYRYAPGGMLFRDPTKFYVITAISYAMLIGYACFRLLQQQTKMFVTYSILTGLVVIWVGLHFSGVSRLFTLITSSTEIPEDYYKFAEFIQRQPNFFRTVWIPQWQRFGYFSDNHPAIGRFELLSEASLSGQLKQITREETESLLTNWGVKYIVVPFDSQKEIFLTDRIYDESLVRKVTSTLDGISWLKKNNDFTQLTVYEVQSPKSRFWIAEAKDSYLHAYRLSATDYVINLDQSSLGETLVFAESYSSYWTLTSDGITVVSAKTKDGMNSFVLPQGYTNFYLTYKPQKGVIWGSIVSVSTVGGLLVFLVLFFFKRRMLK